MVITVITMAARRRSGGIGSIFSSAIDQVDKALSSTIASTATPVSIARPRRPAPRVMDRQPDS